MQSLVSSFSRYIADIAGARALANVRPSARSADRLPIYLTLKYEPYDATLFDTQMALLFCKADKNPPPSDIENHDRTARQHLSVPVVFVFENLAPHERSRLVERGVSFVVPGKQAFLLPRLVDLRERVLSPERRGRSESLSAPSQAIVLLQLILNSRETEDWPLYQWAEKLEYSRMSISRASKELESRGICRLLDRGREIRMQFQRSEKALWETALPYMATPVKRISYASVLQRDKLHFLEAGLSALSRFSDLSAPERQVLAGSESEFKAAVKEGVLRPEQFPDERGITIERWRYTPATLSQDIRTVDRFSLYLSLWTQSDERVLSALEKLIQW